MWSKIINKKSFTLIELIIVVSIISLVYYLTLDNFKLNINISNKISLNNLPIYLKKQEFDNTLSLKCIKDGKKCLLYIDGSIKEQINNLFAQKPNVYTYNKDLDLIYFNDIELNELDSYEVCFEYNINKYKKSKDIIVEVGQKVYIYNSLDSNVTTLDYISDVRDYFDKKEQEVRDAF